MDLILGDAAIRTDLCAMTAIREIKARWQPELETFIAESQASYLYD
jgi:hypothetical protein